MSNQSNAESRDDVPIYLTPAQDDQLIDNGYEPIVCDGKRAVADGWQAEPITAERIASERAALPQARNTGIRTGRIVADDVDLTDANQAKAMRDMADAMLGKSYDIRVGAKGSIALYRNSDAPIAKISICEVIGKKVRTLVEVLGKGRQFVAYGIHPDTGKPYRWIHADPDIGGFHPLVRPTASLALVTPEKIRECMRSRLEWLKENGHPDAYLVGDVGDAAWKSARKVSNNPIYEADYVAMLGRVDCDTDRDTWLRHLAEQRSAHVIRRDGTELTDDDLYRHALLWSRGEYDHASRYKDEPPESFLSSNSGQSLIGEDAVSAAFWSLKPARDGHADRTIASLIAAAKKAGYIGPTNISQGGDTRPPHDVFKNVMAGADTAKSEWIAAVDIFGGADDIKPELSAGALPPVLENFAHDEAARLGTDPATFVVPLLVACSHALHAKFTIEAVPGWKQRALLWGALIGASGGTKSPVLDKCVEPLEKVEDQLANRNSSAWGRYKSDLAQWEKQNKDFTDYTKMKQNKEQKIERLEKLWRDAHPEWIPKPSEPLASPHLVVTKITTEKLRDMLAKNDGRGILHHPGELTKMLTGFDMYRGKSAQGADEAFYLDGRDGRRDSTYTKTDDGNRLPYVAVGVLGGITPKKLRHVAAHLSEGGFLQRFLVGWTPELGDEDDEREPNADAVAAYTNLIQRMATELLPVVGVGGAVASVHLSPEAKAVWRDFQSYRKTWMKVANLQNEDFASHLSKWKGIFAELLLVLHAVEYVAQAPSAEPLRMPPLVSGETAERARALAVEYLMPGSEKLYRSEGDDTDQWELARKVASFILTRHLDQPDIGTLTPRDIYQTDHSLRPGDYGANPRNGRVRLVQEAGEMLEVMGWLYPEETKPGRGVTSWLINPGVHQQFHGRALAERDRKAALAVTMTAWQTTRGRRSDRHSGCDG